MRLWSGSEARAKYMRTLIAAALTVTSCVHQPSVTSSAVASRVEVVDLTGRFLAFYDSASSRGVDADERWALWRRLYGFAAVPPTAFGQQLARQLLDSAWTRYPAALAQIRRGVAALGMSPDSAVQRVADLLKCGDSVKVRLRLFVGGFEGNAFAWGMRDGWSNIAVPVEAGNPIRSMIHEVTHAIHRDGCAKFRTDYGQSLAELIVTEGLAMRVVESALPGHDATFYIEAAPGWLAEARARRDSILAGISAHLTDSGPETVQRFTFGTGATGLRREAYYAGWEIVGALKELFGMSLHEIATADPADYPVLIQRVIKEIAGTPRREQH